MKRSAPESSGAVHEGPGSEERTMTSPNEQEPEQEVEQEKRHLLHLQLKNSLHKTHQIKMEIHMLNYRIGSLHLDAFYGREDAVEALQSIRALRQELDEKRQELAAAELHYQQLSHTIEGFEDPIEAEIGGTEDI